MPSIFPQFFAFEQLAPFLLRIVLGIIFISHGYPKLFKVYNETVKFFELVNIRPAQKWVFVIGSIEFFGGILLILGFLTQLVALLLTGVMVVALWVQKKKLNKSLIGGYELDLILLVSVFSLVLLGAGAFAIDLSF